MMHFGNQKSDAHGRYKKRSLIFRVSNVDQNNRIRKNSKKRKRRIRQGLARGSRLGERVLDLTRFY